MLAGRASAFKTTLMVQSTRCYLSFVAKPDVRKLRSSAMTGRMTRSPNLLRSGRSLQAPLEPGRGNHFRRI
jgi:hypothetical protein